MAEALERPVAALGRGQRDDVADLGVVDRVLEPVGEHRIAVGHVEADVDLEPLADLPLGLGDPVMGVDGEAANLDLDGESSLGAPPRADRTSGANLPAVSALAAARRAAQDRLGDVERLAQLGDVVHPEHSRRRAAPARWRRSCRRAARRPRGP